MSLNDLANKALKKMENDHWQDLPLLDNYYNTSVYNKIAANVILYIFKINKQYKESKPSILFKS